MRPEHGLQRYARPAEGGCVHQAATLYGPGNADAYAEQLSGIHALGDRVDAGDHQPGDLLGLQAGLRDRVRGQRQRCQGAVEEADLDMGLADVHAHDLRVVRADPEQGAWPATVRVDRAGLGDHAVADQVGDDVGDGRRAEAGGAHELQPAARTVEIESRQQRGPVVTPQVARCLLDGPEHVLNCATADCHQAPRVN
ncbi:hypothetical protein GCM10029964_098890 [Kibdelosporangium lantanae]